MRSLLIWLWQFHMGSPKSSYNTCNRSALLIWLILLVKHLTNHHRAIRCYACHVALWDSTNQTRSYFTKGVDMCAQSTDLISWVGTRWSKPMTNKPNLRTLPMAVPTRAAH